MYSLHLKDIYNIIRTWHDTHKRFGYTITRDKMTRKLI